jgi:hypothetical protein
MFYRSDTGAWINISLCNRLGINDDGDSYSVVGFIDCSDTEEITLILEEGFDDQPFAQNKLDEIMEKFNEG